MLLIFAFLYYIALFFDEYISFHPFLIAIALVLTFFFFFGKKVKVLLLVALLFAFSSVLDKSEVSITLPYDEVFSISGVAIEDSRIRDAGSGFYIALDYVTDSYSGYSSASGVVYVLSERVAFGMGTYVMVKGRFISPDVFLANHIELSGESAGYGVRRKCKDFLRTRFSSLDEDERDLAMMLLLGSADSAGTGILEKGRAKGVSHVFALSGMHLVIISAIITLPLSLFLSERKSRALSLPFLFFFTFTSGFRPSLSRAMIMSLLSFFNIRGEILLLLSFLIHTSFFPLEIMTASSALSYLALAGMMYFSPCVRGVDGKLLKSAITSLSALSFTALYSVLVFSSYTLLSIPFTIIISPLVSLFMTLSIFSLFLPFLLPILSFLYDLIFNLLSLPDIPFLSGMAWYDALIFPALVFLRVHGGKKRTGI